MRLRIIAVAVILLAACTPEPFSFARSLRIGVDPDEAIKKEFMTALLQQFKLRAAQQTAPVLLQQQQLPCPASGVFLSTHPVVTITDH